MSGMKAGVVYPTWPDMNGEIIPHIVFNIDFWTVENFNYYDQHPFMAALIQTLHRISAYILFIYGLLFGWKVIKAKYNNLQHIGSIVLITLLVAQVVLGIITVINCKGSIPVTWGVLHQFFALMLLSAALFMNYQFVRRKV
jgi:cytochrome c oxidase assembly protein subunit 15